MKTIKIGLLGLGNIGTGTYKTLEMNRSEIESTLNAKVEIVKILERDTERDRGITVPKEKFTSDPDEIFQDPEIDIVIELLGGIEPATTFMLSALKNGKHVVTANKAALAANYHELINTAKENNVILRFEASVGGGIPIIRTINESLAGDVVEEISGILNGTTNYILTKMFEDGMDFTEALAKATELGYAEADPAADVEGLDAGRKVAIMATSAFHSQVKFSDVYTEGITKITAADVNYAKEMGNVIKLIGIARNTSNGIEAGVYPMMIDKKHPLATVRDSFNAVFVHGDTMFYGRGAGELPTASAVVGDVMDVTRNIVWNCTGRIGWSAYKELPIKEFADVKNRFFIRMQVSNEPGVLAAIAKVFGDHKVSIERVIQEQAKAAKAELVIGTSAVKEYHLQDALEELKEMPIVSEISSIIREY